MMLKNVYLILVLYYSCFSQKCKRMIINLADFGILVLAPESK